MYLRHLLAGILSVASLTKYAAANLRITADHFSFGGVNYPGLQSLEPEERDKVIRAIVKSDARVIRLFIRPDKKNPDPEVELGVFDQRVLDVFDDTLAAIHRISKGKVKVIIAPHDSHALRASNDVPCDAYCQKIEDAFLDFYSNEAIRENYKTRLQVFFKEYPSKNFKGRSWNTLNEVILGVDIQNEPWSGISPIPAGEAWLCDVATHLKDTLHLGQNNIAVISGGISGAQSVDGTQNFPDSAFDCKALDVIAIHGYYQLADDATAGTSWAKLFIPGNTLTSRALGNKLLLVEEMAYVNSKFGLAYKKAAIWDQGAALNYRGIPWIYSQLTTEDEGTSARVSILREDNFAIGALKDVLKRAFTARSNFDWSKYLPAPPALSNLTVLPLNTMIPEQSPCVFGCEGQLCDAADGCRPEFICKNSICTTPPEAQLGKVGADCNSKNPCLEHLRCEDNICQECVSRPSIQPDDPSLRARGPFRLQTVENDINGQCHLDTDFPFTMRNWCLSPQPFNSTSRRGNPCTNAAQCDANEFCDWGFCKVCEEGCLGMKCRSSNRCKTGFCNEHGRCDYPLKPRKMSHNANAWRDKRRGPGWNAGPRNQQGGPNRVRDEAMRINIPTEGVQATGKPVAT